MLFIQPLCDIALTLIAFTAQWMSGQTHPHRKRQQVRVPVFHYAVGWNCNQSSWRHLCLSCSVKILTRTEGRLWKLGHLSVGIMMAFGWGCEKKNRKKSLYTDLRYSISLLSTRGGEKSLLGCDLPTNSRCDVWNNICNKLINEPSCSHIFLSGPYVWSYLVNSLWRQSEIYGT